MVVPLPPTLLPPHPCLAEPPPDVVKGALPYRTALRLLILLHIFLVIAILISPAPHLAFSHCVSIFLGLMACHSTMPLRYNLYALITLFVCISSTIRFADRVTLPEFGHSHTYRVLQLAQVIDAIVDAETEATGSTPRLILRHGPSKQPLVKRNDTSVNVRDLMEMLHMIQNSPSIQLDNMPKTSGKEASGKSFLQGSQASGSQDSRNHRGETRRSNNALEPDLSGLSFLESPGVSLRPNQRVAPMAIEPDIWPLRKTQSLDDFQAITGYSFLQAAGSTPVNREPIRLTQERLQEFVNFRPAVWRSTLEMVALGISSLVTGLTTVLAFVCGRKIERQVNVSIARAFGIDQEGLQGPDGSTAPLITPTPTEPPPEPYRFDPMGERAVAYRPFTGQEATLESWLAQGEQTQPTQAQPTQTQVAGIHAGPNTERSQSSGSSEAPPNSSAGHPEQHR